MKNTLEYEILKYLSDNNKGRFIDISKIESDTDFLKSVITDLKDQELILTEPYPGTPWTGGFIGTTPSEMPEKCKIKSKGLEYLDNLEKSNVDFELAKRTLKEFPKTKIRAKVAYIIAIILAILQLVKWIISLVSKN